uniref:Calcium dependent secretion activator 2 n=1 Tax=Tetraodon nigroviridis TaxID=99883 RepID=H3CYI5_TETNG
REEEERKVKLQIYVFVLRCIAYPFNAKQPTDMARRQQKVNKQQLQAVKERFQAFLSGETSILADEVFGNALRCFYEGFLRSERVTRMVQSGGCSANDFREVFKKNIERRVRSLPEINGLSKETVLSSWMAKFDAIYKGEEHLRRPPPPTQLGAASELILSKEQLFQMFQQILGVRKVEHQLLYNACQLDNQDEQAAQIRRELDGRLQLAQKVSRERSLPRLVSADMEPLYLEELASSVSLLRANLEALPVSRGGAPLKQRLKRSSLHSSFLDLGEEGPVLAKADVLLSFTLEVVVVEVQGLRSLAPNRIVYCTMEVEGGEKLQTDQAEASRPQWGTQGDFTTSQPLPSVKVKLFTESTGVLALEDKELGRVVLSPTSSSPKHAELHRMAVPKNSPDTELKIKLAVRMDKPPNMKHSGGADEGGLCFSHLFAVGQRVWRRWKRRYFVLVQVTQYTFAMCSYREKKAEPQELMQLEGYTVDYCDPQPGRLQGGAFFFHALREGDLVTFSCEDQAERTLMASGIWTAGSAKRSAVCTAAVKKLRAAGRKRQNRVLSLPPSAWREVWTCGSARKWRSWSSAPPSCFDHAALFTTLQRCTLQHRMNDSFSCLGWFSPGQVFVLDEYCARYGVRGCRRHLSYLSDLMDYSENNALIDPTLLHYSYAFCASHVHGNRPDGVGAVTLEERDGFLALRRRLMVLLENHITHFRYCFPFGRPDGALKATLALQERVLMKDATTPVPPEDLRNLVRRCLQEAARLNYSQLLQYAHIKGSTIKERRPLRLRTSERRLEEVLRLGELCLDVLQQNQEHHHANPAAANPLLWRLQAFSWWPELMTEHAETFLSLYRANMDAALQAQPIDSWNSFPLFQLLNNFLRSDAHLSGGSFHRHLQDVFVPLVVRYIDLMESSIAQSLHRGFQQETWEPLKPLSGVMVKLRLKQINTLFNYSSILPMPLPHPPSFSLSLIRSTVWPEANGSATSEDLFWKLDALQMFLADLRWPEPDFAKHLEQRLKLMAGDMVDACVRRTRAAFDVRLQKVGGSSDWRLPPSVCTMFNVLMDARRRSSKLCVLDPGQEQLYHSRIDVLIEETISDMISCLVTKFSTVLHGLLSKLSRYDEGTLFSSILSFTTEAAKQMPAVPNPGSDLADAYIGFVRQNQDVLRAGVGEELLLQRLFDRWFGASMEAVCVWLTDRLDLQLHSFQLRTLISVVKSTSRDLRLQGLDAGRSNGSYESVCRRLTLEEATAAVKAGDGLQG